MPSYLVAFVGLYLLIAGVAFLVWWLWRRRQKSIHKQTSTHVAQPTPPIRSAQSAPPAQPISPNRPSYPQPIADVPAAVQTPVLTPPQPTPPVAEQPTAVVTAGGLTFQGQALQALNLMMNSGHSLFITGKAGTGKSTLLRHFVDLRVKKVAVVAPTGIAALNVRGQTIHSFFRFPPKLLSQADLKVPRNTDIYQQIDALIVDEISMVRADMMDMMDHFLRRARGNPAPFGGVQMILFGDPYQLPPVVREDEVDDYLKRNYGGRFFFDAPGYRQARITTIELDHIYRQRDPAFINALNQVRIGQQNVPALTLLNGRYNPLFDPQEGDGYFMLTTNNARVAEINQTRLALLPAREQVYPAMVMGKFNEKNYPTDFELHLKPGAQVMLIRNDSERRWVNGSVGWITKLGPSAIEVRLAVPLRSSAAIVEVQRESWEDIRYRYDAETDTLVEEVIGSFTQFPIKLSWAMTIHKSQGQTFDKVLIDMDRGAFADGQTYVALSRCKSLEGIVLKTEIRPSDIRVSSRIHEFMQS